MTYDKIGLWRLALSECFLGVIIMINTCDEVVFDLIAASRSALSSSSIMSESRLSFSSSLMNLASRRNEN